jgi:ribosomal-protein-alanine N-acetyltransferase
VELACGICRVRSWRSTDRAVLARHADNPKVAVNLRDRFPNPYTLADADTWLKLASETQPETNFAIELDGAAVGGIGFEILDDFDRCSAEIGYWLGESVWGRGLATVALRAVTDYAFANHSLTRIFAIPFAGNARSRRVLENAGYALEGIMRRSVRKRGIVIDAALYAVTR